MQSAEDWEMKGCLLLVGYSRCHRRPGHHLIIELIQALPAMRLPSQRQFMPGPVDSTKRSTYDSLSAPPGRRKCVGYKNSAERVCSTPKGRDRCLGKKILFPLSLVPELDGESRVNVSIRRLTWNGAGRFIRGSRTLWFGLGLE